AAATTPETWRPSANGDDSARAEGDTTSTSGDLNVGGSNGGGSGGARVGIRRASSLELQNLVRNISERDVTGNASAAAAAAPGNPAAARRASDGGRGGRVAGDAPPLASWPRKARPSSRARETAPAPPPPPPTAAFERALARLARAKRLPNRDGGGHDRDVTPLEEQGKWVWNSSSGVVSTGYRAKVRVG
ncbi:unnamed protein product, partial [Laminaria digitata]